MGSPRYCHIDMLYSRSLQGVYVPRVPSIGFKSHDSKIYAGTSEGNKEKKPVRKGFEAKHEWGSFSKRLVLKTKLKRH